MMVSGNSGVAGRSARKDGQLRMSDINTRASPETARPAGYERPIRLLFMKLFLGFGLIAFALGAAAFLLANRSGFSVAGLIAPAIAFAVASGAGCWLALRSARLFSAPANALLGYVEPDGQWLGTEGAYRSADELAAEFASLAAAVQHRLDRDDQRLDELMRARDDAQNANIAKSQFLTNMSHQLRTPLNAIIGYATLLQEDATAAGETGHVADLGRVLHASRNLLELINDILELSKIDVGKTSFQRAIIDVASLIRSVTTSIDLDQQGNGNSFETQVESGIGIMVGDGAKIRQCLLNLVSNALKFTHEGQVRLIVTGADQDGADMIRFTVSDTGMGMSPELVSQLFRDRAPDRGDSTSGPKLGLAITHRLATMMGGSVSVRSLPGKGSVFTLSIPREMPRNIPSEDVLPFIEKGRMEQGKIGDRTALIIDDDPSAIDLMGRWLKRLGYRIISAEGGENGFALAREHKPDLIILDILMPGMDGYEVLEALRADQDTAKIPVVVVSVCDDRSGALRAGAAEWLMKPVKPKLLEQVLDVYCKRLDGEILVIEDDPDSGALIQRTAGQIGLGCRIARDGEEGLAMIRANPPAAIVLDLGLPGMSGFQVLEELGADRKLNRIPVLIVSGHEISVAEHQAIEKSGGIYHPKGNTSPREIANSLRMVVSR